MTVSRCRRHQGADGLCVPSVCTRLVGADGLCVASVLFMFASCPVWRDWMPCVTPLHALCDATACSPTPFLGQGCVDTSETIIDITHERDKDRHVDISHERDKDRVASSSC